MAGPCALVYLQISPMRESSRLADSRALTSGAFQLRCTNYKEAFGFQGRAANCVSLPFDSGRLDEEKQFSRFEAEQRGCPGY